MKKALCILLCLLLLPAGFTVNAAEARTGTLKMYRVR